MLYFIFAFALIQSITSKVLLESPLDKYSKQTSLVNAFPGCLVHVINFFGYNLNFTQLFQPIILLRFIPHDIYMDVYAVEDVRDWESAKNVSLWGNGEASLKYLDYIFQEWLELASKNTNCEANIYFHPPNSKRHKSYYYQRRDLDWDLVLKDPFWLYKDLHWKTEEWKRDYVSTVPKYSFLVCSSSFRSACHNYESQYQWISTALTSPEFLRLSEYIFIWTYNSEGEWLHAFCPYCNPCDPFETLKFQVTRKTLRIQMHKAMNAVKQFSPHSIEAIVYFDLSKYKHLKSKGHRSRTTLLEYLKYIPQNDVFLPFSIDIHVMSLLVPENVTLQFSWNYDKFWGKWKEISIDSCPDRNKNIWQHGMLRPLVHRSTRDEISSHQHIGLIFQRKQLRFVSCHKEQSPWLHQLQELVVAFDIYTWLLLIFSCGVVAHIASLNKKDAYSFCNNCFSLVASVMDQSSNLFARPENNKVLLFGLPLLFLILSNEYTGENITNLTLQPTLVPFDTFEQLTQNNFTTFTRNWYLTDETYNKMKPVLAGNKFARISKHEAYPVVSELWFQILQRFTVEKMNVLSKMKDQISQTALSYLQHSELFPEWKQGNGDLGGGETVKQILSTHMEACNKAAMILDENFALSLYTSLKSLNKPAYFGKDVITENLMGYKYYGYWPTGLKLKPRYFFQTGIVEWWQKYLKWYTVLRMHTEKTTNISGLSTTTSQNEPATTGIYVLSFIPAIGLCLSIIAFLCFDSKILGFVISSMTHLAWSITNFKIVQLYRKNAIMDQESRMSNDSKLIEPISCLLCNIRSLNISFKSIQELDLHMANVHTEYLFLDGLMTDQKLYHFHSICNLVLNSEFETADVHHNDIVEKRNNLKCPFECTLLEFENLRSLKFHLILCHRQLLLDRLQSLMVLDDSSN